MPLEKEAQTPAEEEYSGRNYESLENLLAAAAAAAEPAAVAEPAAALAAAETALAAAEATPTPGHDQFRVAFSLHHKEAAAEVAVAAPESAAAGFFAAPEPAEKAVQMKELNEQIHKIKEEYPNITVDTIYRMLIVSAQTFALDLRKPGIVSIKTDLSCVLNELANSTEYSTNKPLSLLNEFTSPFLQLEEGKTEESDMLLNMLFPMDEKYRKKKIGELKELKGLYKTSISSCKDLTQALRKNPRIVTADFITERYSSYENFIVHFATFLEKHGFIKKKDEVQIISTLEDSLTVTKGALNSPKEIPGKILDFFEKHDNLSIRKLNLYEEFKRRFKKEKVLDHFGNVRDDSSYLYTKETAQSQATKKFEHMTHHIFFDPIAAENATLATKTTESAQALSDASNRT